MKNLFTLLALLATTSMLSAQAYIGVKTGMTKHTLKAEGTSVDLSNVINEMNTLTAGIIGGYQITDNFGVQTEINYARRGFTVEALRDVSILDANVIAGLAAETRLDYIEVPVLARGKFGSGDLKIYVEGGPYVGYAAGGNIKVKGRFIADIIVADEEINLDDDAFQRFDYGASYGAGVEYTIGRGMFSFGVRGQESFTSSLDDNALGLQLRNSAIGANISYAYSF